VKTLIMMVGLPRSGKSTLAKKESERLNAPIVCPDHIRLAMHGQPYVPSAEPLVWATTHLMVHALFMSYDTVILDACNNTKKRRNEWLNPKWRREFLIVDTPRTVCLERAGDNEGLRAAIGRMILQHEQVEKEEKSGQPSRY